MSRPFRSRLRQGRVLRLAIAVAAFIAMLPRHCLHADEPSLPTYNADIRQTSISGVSSGAFMAVQFGMAWSSVVIGVGAIAGGPYGCSEGSESAALDTCMVGQPAPHLRELTTRTDTWSRSGEVDDTAGIARQRIYLFSGYNDKVVARSVSNALQAFYAHYLGRDRLGNLFYQTAIGAGHAQVTIAYGGGCAANGGKYINKCGYDQAGIILQHIYGALSSPDGGASTGHLITFRQADFTGSRKPVDDSLDDKGFAYVPASCEARERCRVHVALHGCLQAYGNIGEDFVRHAGYNEWADANHIIVLYPQVQAVGVTSLGITNPQACWDWWGYLDSNPYCVADLSAEVRPADQRDQGDDRPHHHWCIGVGYARRVSTRRAIDGARAGCERPRDRPGVVRRAGASSYDVFRAAPSDQEFRQVGTVSGLSYGDAGLKPATLYRYRVRVSSAGATNPFSTVVSQSTRPRVAPCSDPGTCAVR